MSPGRNKPQARRPAQGSGPAGRIELSDLSNKLGEIRGEVDEATESARPMLTYAGVGGVVLVILLAFLFGKRKGRRKSTWVEIRRK